jgi:two-component system LytT family response regulator
MKLQCLIVDDEPPAHKVLESYIARIENLILAGNCYTAYEAINFLHKNQVDIIFLDIEMPELSGIEMLGTLNHAPSVILTTAYSQFALNGFELGVSDYLLKPIRFERFLKSVNRLIELKINNNPAQFFFVKTDGDQHKVNFADIQFIEAYGNFLKIHTIDKVLLTAETLTEMQNRLPEASFLHVHKSYLVNKDNISKIYGNQIFMGNQIIPIGSSYRKDLLIKLNIR